MIIDLIMMFFEPLIPIPFRGKLRKLLDTVAVVIFIAALTGMYYLYTVLETELTN